MSLCSTTVVQRVSVLAEILGDPPGLNWIQIRETFGGPPPLSGHPREPTWPKISKNGHFQD